MLDEKNTWQRILKKESHGCFVTFDDGNKGWNDFALPILNKHGFTATVFVCTSLNRQRQQMEQQRCSAEATSK